MSALPWDAIGIGSGWALVALFVVLIYRGKLIPRSSYDDQVHEKNEARTESRLRAQENLALTEQNNTLLHEIAPTLTHFLQDMRETARKEDHS